MVVKEKCSTSNQTSFPEKVIAFYLKQAGLLIEENIKLADKVIQMAEFAGNKSLDIYFEVKNKKFVVEYDGYYYHKDTRDVDKLKNEILKLNSVNVIRIREKGLKPLDNFSYDYILDNNHNIESLEKSLLFIEDILSRVFNIKTSFDIDIKRDMNLIQGMLNWTEEYNSVARVRPDLAKEWNYNKNPFGPNCINFMSHQLVWWKCEKGHEWQARPLNRAEGNKCPYCGNRKLLRGYNDFKTLFPDLIKYWYKGNSIKPYEILGKSNIEVLWQCPKCGDIFENKVYKFVNKKTKCSHCKDKGIK